MMLLSYLTYVKNARIRMDVAKAAEPFKRETAYLATEGTGGVFSQ